MTHSQSNLKLSQLARARRALTGAWCHNLRRLKSLLHFPHFPMYISSQFPTAPCSCVVPIYVDMMPGFILGVPQSHDFQIFHKLRIFLKGVVRQDTSRRELYSAITWAHSIYFWFPASFVFLLLFLMTQGTVLIRLFQDHSSHDSEWVLGALSSPPVPCDLFLLNTCRVLHGGSSST